MIKDGQEVCRKLIEKRRNLVTTLSSHGYTILHSWAQDGKVWPFECIRKCNYIIEDIDKVLVDLMCYSNNPLRNNPFHSLAQYAPDEEDAVKITQVLLQTFENVVKEKPGDLMKSLWLSYNGVGYTPLGLSLIRKYQKLAKYILNLERDAVIQDQSEYLLLAIRNGCEDVAKSMLDNVDPERWASLTNGQLFNALHYAPSCTQEFVRHLLDSNPNLMARITKDEHTILHAWMDIGKVWPFEYILNRVKEDPDCKTILRDLINKTDRNRDNIFHYATRYYNETTTTKIVQLLADGYKNLYEIGKYNNPPNELPWFQLNYNFDGALHEAIRGQREELAILILSLHVNNYYYEILDSDMPRCKILFLAIENKCYKLAKKIMLSLNKQSWTPYLEDSFKGQNILHLAHQCTDTKFGKWLITTAQQFITEKDTNGITPLDKASEAGVDWLVRAMLQTDANNIFQTAPLAWVEACKNGHVSTVRVFIDCHPRSFKDHCNEHKISPLHHIKLPNTRSYEEFLKLPYMMDLINFKDSTGKTPLHTAVRNEDIYMTEALLQLKDISYEIEDGDGKTARSLLRMSCKEDQNWKKMCEDIGFDPSIKMNYLHRKTNLLDVRNTLSVVAALLATITFTAGFTLPGGLNQDNGEAMLARKAAFVVFMISDTIALCCSILVLICLIWSIINDSSRSMLLIDRSMNLLMISLIFTMIAFICGVFIVISYKTMWVAILVIVMCALLATAIIGSLLYQLLKSIFHKAQNGRFIECF